MDYNNFKTKTKIMSEIRNILLLYIQCMTIVAIISMKPNGIGGWSLSVLWIASIVGLYYIKPKEDEEENTHSK